MKKKRIIPKIKRGHFTVLEFDVCDIDDYIGSDEDICTLHYALKGVDYNYGHDYVKQVADNYVTGYYIGMDRFVYLDDAWSKEYALFEYALFLDDDAQKAGEILLSHLVKLAKVTGCSRITLDKDGANSRFLKLCETVGFVQEGDKMILHVKGAKMPKCDSEIIPKKSDAIGHYDLFFLREEGFELDSKKAVLNINGETITVDRSTGACEFSGAFSVIGNGISLLMGEKAWSIIDICRQLLNHNHTSGIVINVSDVKENELTPDVSVDGMGVFIMEKYTTLGERREFRAKLQELGTLEKYAFYKHYFDREVGGLCDTLAFADVR